MAVEAFIDFDVVQLQKNLDKFEEQLFPIAVSEGLQEVKDVTLRKFRRTVRTFSAPQPQFTAVTSFQGGIVGVDVSTDHFVYGLLDAGTPVRRAIMSRDFVSKTVPGSLKTRRGRGGVVFISKKISRPGIKARNFSSNIAEEMETEAPEIIDRHIDKAVKLKEVIIGKGV